MENPLRTDREIIEHVLTTYLPSDANREERRQAIAAAQQALHDLPPDASDVDELEAATGAVQPIADQVKRRCQIECIYRLRYLHLPAERTEQDVTEWQRIIADAVHAMPADASDFAVYERAREVTAPLVRRIEARRHRPSLIDHGKNYLSAYLDELRRERMIDRYEWLDRRLKAGLEQAVTEELQDELTGEEEPAAVEAIVRSVVDEELEIEDEDVDEDEEEG